jgi:hypothetical protein
MVVENVNDTELRFKNPGRLLLVVFGFLFWAIGFIDLIGHTSAEPDLFGIYSIPFFILIMLYGSTIIIWFLLFFNSKLLSRVADGVKYIQNHTWLALAIFVGLGVALWVIFEWDRWSRLPGLQVAALGLVLLTGFIILFSNWDESKGQQKWRRVGAFILIALVAIEALIQLVAYFGFLPGIHTIGGEFVPYERIYNNTDGLRNDFANRYGAPTLDFNMEAENKRILVVGGNFVQGLQIQPGEHLSVLLTDLIAQNNSSEDLQTEVISIGLPGFGLSPFLFEDAIRPPNVIDYDEIIAFFHLGDDFQSPDLSHNGIVYSLDSTGKADVHPSDARLRHDLTHFYQRGFISMQPVETLRSNYLTPKIIKGLIGNLSGNNPISNDSAEESEIDFSRIRGFVTDNYPLTEPGHAGIRATESEVISQGNNFIFKQNGTEGASDAILIADSILETAQNTATSSDITLRIVTIPVFPEAFYTTHQAGSWDPQIGEYDLLLPEKALIEIARNHDIQILPMGHYMLEDQLTVEEVKALYSSNGLDHFTSQGHEYFANAIYTCFYMDAAHDCFE